MTAILVFLTCIGIVVFRATLLRPILIAIIVKRVALETYSMKYRIHKDACNFSDVANSPIMEVVIQEVVPRARGKWEFAFDLSSWTSKGVLK